MRRALAPSPLYKNFTVVMSLEPLTALGGFVGRLGGGGEWDLDLFGGYGEDERQDAEDEGGAHGGVVA